MNLALFGIKGCGKTTFGKKIATLLKRAFIDTDTLIEDFYQAHRGQKLSCPEIFKEVGPMGFRSLEYETIQSLQDVQNSVIAVGGGAMMRVENVEALTHTSHLFYLIFEKEALKKRILSQEHLPFFLDPEHPETSFDQMYDERDEFYRKIKASEIDVTKMKTQDVVNQICDLFKKGQNKQNPHGQ